jgi:hypothetical protein
MIPQGDVFENLRIQMLDFFPLKCRSKVNETANFADWIERGYYSVQKASGSKYLVEADTTEFSSLWLTDVENLSNHCAEHLREMIRNGAKPDSISDAWQTVTIYYYAYYAAQGLLRILGQPVVFLNQAQAASLETLAGTTSKGSRGSYVVKKESTLSTIKSQYSLRLKSGNNHDSVWSHLFSLLKEAFDKCKKSTSSSELQLYSALLDPTMARICKSPSWPSVIRNKANYTPGYAYRSVQKQDVAKSRRLILEWKETDLSILQKSLDASLNACKCHGAVSFDRQVRLMHVVAHTLFFILRQLYFDLYNRRNFDKRWEEHRRDFFASLDSIGYSKSQLFTTMR